ncbi:A-kinase anchor protein 9 isoform X2 [Colossoma macropomum]|uniref:A-kinase anchor protein 9 isoform X2 n=1 Tax=Colossoma macropomum TaxID=42526 RepID=UPI001864C903|nr:A-kinase anchor protein 9 isoform X2 [Colossoma macropomum]
MKPVSPSAASRAAAMEDEERRRKLEAGRAKLAEYRQRKAQSDGQKKQKKKKQKGSEPEDSGVQQEGAGERKETPTTEFSFSRTLRSGETVKHDQTYTIEPESEVSTTAEDYSSEVNGCHELSQRSLEDEELHPPVSPLEEELQQAEPPSRLQAMEDELAAKNLAVEELSRELEEIRAAFGAEGVQQLQDFEAALKQRDGIITQLTANLQQARTEKDEVMREFLELTEQSQKLQLQFQQLQVGESLRSSSISNAAADLQQAKQQVLFFQQQLEDRDVQVKGLQVQLEERDIEVKGLQEKLLQMTQLQQRLSQIETVTWEAEESFTQRLKEKDLRVAEQEKLLAELQDGLRASEQRLQQVTREAEESFAQRLQEKDLRIAEQERLMAEQQQLLAQLQDNLQASKNHLNEVSEQLAMKVRELEACELELQTSRQKERLSSGEIQQLMGTVEDLQKRYHHQGAEQGDTARKMDHLRAELDEMYGQQIVQMKQELSARHAEELAHIQNQHSAEVDKISEHLRAKWTQSAGEVNALNARVVELQQKLQENQVLREKAEQDLAHVSEDRFLLQNRVRELVEDLRLAKQRNEMEKSQTVQQELQAAISDLQAKLAAAQEASSELEAKHESEITNYQIKLEMLEREKDAVLDRMAESQEAELERLRTQLLFSHEEELSRLREDLQHESQMNMENLRDELRQVRNGYEAEKAVMDAERASLLQEIVVLKHDLSQALENSRADELVLQLKELQEEIQELRKRDSEKSGPEVEETWERTWKDSLESENKLLKEKEAAMAEELKSLKQDHEVLLKKMGTLATDNEKANKLVEDLRAEIEKQKTTFSFAEKNFEVNYQELREELEERLREKTLQYEAKLQKLQTKLQTPEQGDERRWTEEKEEKELDGGALVEKDATELMEKLQRVELEKAGLEEKVEQKQTELQKMEGELQRVVLEKVELLEQKEAQLRRVEVEKVALVEQTKQKEVELCALRDEVKETALKNSFLEKELEALKQKQLEDGGVCSIKDHHLQITALEEELQALRTLRSAEQDRLAVLQQEEQALSEQKEEEDEEVEAVPVEGLLAPPLALTGRERESTVFTAQRAHSLSGGSGGVVVTETQQEQVKIRDVLSHGETGVQEVTRPLSMEGSDHEECRLQMEALRISLSQIHAAQLELLKESLHAQTTVPTDDPRCRSFKEEESEDCRQLAQMVREDQTVRSENVHSSCPAGPPLSQLKEEETDRSSSWEVDRRLRLEFQEQQELQEQQHRQEIQRLRSYYSQQAEETEERYRNEINLLQNRLQELTGAEAIYRYEYSVPGDSPHVQQRADLFQDGQLDELDSLRRESEERARDPEDLQRQREEDIAKVIVQMSVEFAQQTELARISRQAGDEEREKLEEELLQLRSQLEMLEAHRSTCTQQGAEQTDREEEKERGGEEIRRPSMQSSGTQTEARSGEEDEEGERLRKKENVMSQLSSQDTESSSDFITTERNLLRKANEKLRQVLVDVLKTTAATEETIGRHVETLLEASSRGQQPAHRDVSSESFHGSETVADDASVFSAETETDEGLEMSQMLLGAGLQLERVDLQSDGAELQLEREEYLSSISSRLQSAVEKLLFTITETTSQLEHARVTQTELMREKFRHSEEIAELLRRQEELQERLQEEASARQRLALQLHNAEGLIDGYSGERRALEEQVRERAELQLQLEQELQVTSSRLHELEHERQNLHHQRELLHRQQEAMRGGAGGRELRLVEAAGDAAPEADLLEETEKLMQEKVEVQRQAEKEHAELLQQVKQMEAELEEQVGHFAELEETHRAESADLTQQIHALEKQLENNRRFLDEQAVDREHERDVFQQEIQKLEQQLKNPPKPLPSSDQHHREVEELSSALREKADWCSELLLRSEQLQREVEERDEEIEKLESRVRALEQALTANADTLSTAEESKQYASMAAGDDATLEALLQTEREALDRKEKEIVNLEEQLEQFREELQNKSEEVQQLHMQLEIQRKEISTQQQELLAQTNLHAVLEQKDREIALLNEHITKLQLTETSPDNKEVEEKSELVLELEAQVEYLRGEQERLKRDSEEEVEQLNSVIEKLQQELSHIEHKQSPAESAPDEEEYDELKQKMDQVTRELDTLKTDHSSLLGKYESLRQEALERELETEKQSERLEDALRERTAALVVAQAQVQALEESAGSRVSDLMQRIAELEESVEEKELELHACRLQVERAQEDAESLHLKVSQLEDKLREKVAAMLVSQAQLEAVQVQTKELHRDEAVLDEALAGLVRSRAGPEGEGLAVAPVRKVERVGKVGFLTEKLQELEQGLSYMQKDQELQKELLSSSEEEVQEYERRLAVLMELLNQMRTRPPHTPAQSMGDDSTAMEELLQELQEVKGEAAASKEELDSCRELSQKLQEQIKLKEAAMEELEKDLQKASERGSEEDSSKVSELLQQLQEVKGEAAATKEELSSCKEISQKLQEQIQEREMTIALLKDQLHRASGEVDNSELLQELQEVRSEAAATKEELNSYIERSLKLQEQIQVRDVSIAQLMDELQQLRTALSKSSEDVPAQQPQSHSRKKAGKHSEGKGKGNSVAKDKPSLSRKNSNSQPEKSANSAQASSQTRVDAGTQVEQEEVSEELEEVIGEYRERIGQMQELHAAEIMDMENRHISESDSLKRENQRLEQECSALRAAVNNLRSGEAVRLDLPASSQFRDGYTSDSSSDWSQRTGFELPHLQAEFRSTPEGARRDDSEVLPDRIKTLLREVHQEGMQVLSLSEIPVPEAEHPAAQLPLQAWRKEKEALLDTVESLKTLITQLQTHSQTQTETESAGDWRGDLLSAVQQVFLREREVLKVALLNQLDLLDTRDAVIHLNQLERALTDQDAVQREALSSLQSADRRGLLAEITHLRTQLQHLQRDARLTQQPRPVDSSGMSEGWPEAGGEGGGSDGGREGGSDGGRGGAGEREDRLPAAVEDLKGELAQTKLELEVSLQTQSKYLKELETLRAEVCGKASELDSLSDRLAEEQKRVRELQWAMEREKNRAERREKGEREELEDLRLALEDHQARVADLSVSLEEERKVSAQLREERDGEISKHISLNTELQVQLEAQQLQTVELSSSLQKEKELNAQLLKQLPHSNPDTQRPPQAVNAQGVELAEASCSQVEEGVRSVEVLLQSLQDQLTEKQSALVDLMGQLEQQKLQEVQAKRAWEQERGELTRGLQGVRESLAKLERRAEELKAQLDGERERGMRLERERDGLQQRVTELMERSQRDNQQTPWEAEGQPVDRTRDWVLQQKVEEAGTLTSSSTTVMDAAGQTAGQAADARNLDSVINRLQLIASKINSMTSNTAGRLPAEGPDRESLTWLHSSVQDVLSLLQQVPPVPPAVPESAALLPGGSSSALTERLLRQNAELTGFVSRLTEEKNELRNQLLRLEEELRRQRHLSAHNSSRSGSEGQELVLFSSEREAWSREKIRLEKSLRQAEAELSRLRGEIRSDALRDVAAPDTDNSALKRIYGKYLRAESFRKALIYQKKYLLLLLGGFQECEEATLSLIARMGGRPTYSRLESLGQRRRGFTRFRSAVRVSIALSRMRFLVRRWKKATGGSISTPSINRNGLGQSPGIEGRNDSPYLQPSVEQYGDRRGTNRTGRESPRTGHYSHHRCGAAGGDGGSVLCSHLQNYDPDRALTDYISRLEALQRRLGSVQSGSSSYTQLHFGVRR